MVDAHKPKEKYSKKQILNQNQNSSTYLAQSRITSKLYVIKNINMLDMIREQRKVARDEARILQVLNHPNIIQFHDVFKDKDVCLNIVMEWADGGDLY